MIVMKPFFRLYFQQFSVINRFYWVYFIIIGFILIIFLTFFKKLSPIVAQLPSKELYTLQGHHDAVWSVAFSPDGQFLASGSQDKTVKLWEMKTGS